MPFDGPHEFVVQISRVGATTLVAVAGEVDLATVAEFENALRAQLAEGPVRLDLAEVSFMDSSGVRALDGVLRDAARDGWDLRIAPALQDNVRQILDMTAMTGQLPFADSGEQHR